MAPITPLGKPLSQQPFAGMNVPTDLSSVVGCGANTNQPISAFQWVSLARATWTWLLKPLWYLCVKWPVMMILSPSSRKEREERLERLWERQAQQNREERSKW
jgi:hypothetical protein